MRISIKIATTLLLSSLLSSAIFAEDRNNEKMYCETSYSPKSTNIKVADRNSQRDGDRVVIGKVSFVSPSGKKIRVVTPQGDEMDFTITSSTNIQAMENPPKRGPKDRPRTENRNYSAGNDPKVSSADLSDIIIGNWVTIQTSEENRREVEKLTIRQNNRK